jgi:hypothetical protein
MEGHAECVQLLLVAKAAVDQATNGGSTPLFIACYKGHTKCVQLLSLYGASRLLSVSGHQFAAERIAMKHPVVLAWLVASRYWCSPLHHVDVLSEERTTELLRAGADLHRRTPGVVGAPSPLEIARLQPVQNAAAQLILRAAEPWSCETHHLFPVEARSQAVEVLKLGYLLASERRLTDALGQLTDPWCEFVLPLAVER